MYKVVLYNNSEETVINEVTTDKTFKRITGTLKQGINTSNSFSFLIYPNNPGYNKIKGMSTLITIEDTLNKTLIFEGRVLIPTEVMNNSGIFYKSITCESELSYLNDTTQFYKEFKNTDIKDILTYLLSIHNQHADDDKHFEVGIVDINSKIDLTIDYKKTFEVISDIINDLGGELNLRKENNIRYLDYVKSIGEEKDTTIELAKNLETIEKEIDPTSIITQLLPLGAKKDDTEERITIDSSNPFITDDVAIKEFGRLTDVQIFEDITNKSELKTKGQDFLKENNRVKKKYKLSAYDLSLIGLDINSFEVGNSYRVINPLMEMNEVLRIIEKEIKIESPESSSLTIGDKFDDIKTYQINMNKVNKNMKGLVDTTKNINKKIDKTVSDLNNAQTEILQVQSDNSNLNNKVKTLETQMTDVLSDIEDIKSQLGGLQQ